jgi:hypothetical protein
MPSPEIPRGTTAHRRVQDRGTAFRTTFGGMRGA